MIETGWQVVQFNKETGEIKEMKPGKWVPDYKPNQLYVNTGKLRAEKYRHLGSFFLYVYQYTNGFKLVMRPKTAARLMYLATYLSYDGILRVTQRTKMKKKDMARVLGLKRNAFDGFYNEVSAAGALYKTDEGYTLNPQWFVRGAFERPQGITRYTKVFFKTMRRLYEATPPNMHQYLGYVFLMMPYVNVQWNIVCRNPYEEDLDKVQPMTLGDFCDAIGYDRGNAIRLLENYRNITFNFDDTEQYFCSFIYEEDAGDMRIVCNPNIFYIGKHIEKVEAYGSFCIKMVDKP